MPARPAIARSVGIPANKPPTVATEATEATLRVRGADKLRASEARLALTLATAPPEATPAARASESRPAPLASPREPVPASTPPPDATVAPAETPLAVAVVRAGDVAPGGWGQSFAKPLVADDDALATLRAKYRGMRGIAIDVDPSGHATRIEIPDGVSGDDREELMRALSAMRYVPAECNGLRCAGTMQLVL